MLVVNMITTSVSMLHCYGVRQLLNPFILAFLESKYASEDPILYPGYIFAHDRLISTDITVTDKNYNIKLYIF